MGCVDKLNGQSGAEAPERAGARRALVLPVLAGALGHIIWGFSYLFTRVALRSVRPDVLLSIRFLLALLIMNLLILMKKGRVSLRGRNWKPLLVLAVAEPLYFYCESYGILYTNATFAGVVLAVVPVVSIVLAALFLREYPTWRQAVFCLLPVLGVALMAADGSAMGVIRPVGVAFLLGSCLASAGYKTVNRRIAQEFTSFERTYVVLLVSGVVFTGAALVSTGGDLRAWTEPLSSAPTMCSILMLSVFCSVGANQLVNYAAGKLSVVKLSSFGALTTVFSMFAGVVFLREPLSWLGGAGTVLILIGIWQVTRPEARDQTGEGGGRDNDN